MNGLKLDAIIEPTIWESGLGTVLILIAVAAILAVAIWGIVRTVRKSKLRKDAGVDGSSDEEKQ